ncbi:hypothetical protein BC826DRAFT_1191026 [Russula brevipes]|nr:hypothetical protein BC826DRAFT_1191026 [Russula brevipes]
MRKMMAETPSDVTSQPIACDTMSRPLIPEDAGTSAEILSTSFPATTNNKAQGSSMAPIDLNYLDGPTIIDEPSESLQVLQAEKSIAISKPAVEVIDFLTDTPSPMPSASEGEKIASSRNVPTSSPSSLKGRTSDDITPLRSANRVIQSWPEQPHTPTPLAHRPTTRHQCVNARTLVVVAAPPPPIVHFLLLPLQPLASPGSSQQDSDTVDRPRHAHGASRHATHDLAATPPPTPLARKCMGCVCNSAWPPDGPNDDALRRPRRHRPPTTPTTTASSDDPSNDGPLQRWPPSDDSPPATMGPVLDSPLQRRPPPTTALPRRRCRHTTSNAPPRSQMRGGCAQQLPAADGPRRRRPLDDAPLR